MMPYKKIDDNLTTREFNGIVSLLRDNVRFHEDIQINTRNVNGAYGEYQFNFHEATMLDNGVLITNQTLTTIGTVKLVNPAFPHSNYYLDLKVYSSEDIGVLDEEDVLVTPLTVKLVKDTEVNIPFETLEMNNIIGFDATVRIDHKDLVINTGDHLELTANSTAYLEVPAEFTARYLDGAGFPVEGASVSFYEGETFLGSGVSDSEGYVVVEHTFMSLGVHNVFASSSNVFSRNVSVEVINNVMELGISGSSFSTNSSNPFTYNGRVYVDWGDDTGLEEYTGGKLSHTFNDGLNNHGVRVYGGLTILRSSCFYGCTGLTSINIPSSVTALGFECFRSCTGLTSINIPSSVTALGPNCFRSCTGLTSINIPSSVTHLESYCFNGCTGLTSINLNWETSTDILSYKSDWISECPAFQYFIIPEGTKQLYIAKGYPSDKLKEDIAFDDITLTSDKDILSYNGGTNPDTATLTAQLTYEGEPALVEGETVTFEVRKQSDDSLVETLSDVTDSSGVATVSYTSNGAGDLYIKAECSLVSKTYSIRDVYWGGTSSDIASSSHWSVYTGISGRTIYNWLSDFTEDIEITFKFKNNVPSNFLIGLGMFQSSSNNQIKGLFFNNNGAKQIWWTSPSTMNQNETYSTTVTTDSVFRIVTENLHTVKFYIDDILVTTKSTRTTYPLYLRIDDFTDTPSDLEYYTVQKL